MTGNRASDRRQALTAVVRRGTLVAAAQLGILVLLPVVLTAASSPGIAIP
jgi:hypothetical protein